MSRAGSAMFVVILAGCSGGGEQAKPEQVPPTQLTADAGADAVPLPPVSDRGGAPTPRPGQKRPGRAIEVILRSSPPGAQVAVDGTPYGPTPQVWSGETGAEHEFTFTAPNFAMARYRFMPIATGILHARLEPVADDTDAGVPAPPEVVPPVPPMPPMPLSIDAAPLAPPPDAFTPDATTPGLGPPF